MVPRNSGKPYKLRVKARTISCTDFSLPTEQYGLRTTCAPVGPYRHSLKNLSTKLRSTTSSRNPLEAFGHIRVGEAPIVSLIFLVGEVRDVG